MGTLGRCAFANNTPSARSLVAVSKPQFLHTHFVDTPRLLGPDERDGCAFRLFVDTAGEKLAS